NDSGAGCERPGTGCELWLCSHRAPAGSGGCCYCKSQSVGSKSTRASRGSSAPRRALVLLSSWYFQAKSGLDTRQMGGNWVEYPARNCCADGPPPGGPWNRMLPMSSRFYDHDSQHHPQPSQQRLTSAHLEPPAPRSSVRKTCTAL